MGRGDDPVELGGGIILGGPAVTGVEGNVPPPVIPVDHPVGIAGSDPEVVVVAVRNLNALVEALAGVAAPVEGCVQDVDHVRVLGVGVDAGVVEGPLAELSLVVRQGPRLAAVVGAEDAPILVLHDGVHPVLIHRGHGHADLPDQSLLREPRVAGDLCPCLSTVGAPEEAAPGTAGGHAPRFSPRLPERSVDDVGVGGMDGDVYGT